MSQLRTIEIDFDVHKFIESRRHGFDDPPNAVLRRELGIEAGGAAKKEKIVPLDIRIITGKPWRGRGNVILPHGTLLRAAYNNQHIEGCIDDGAWLVNGVFSTTPSAALAAAARTKEGAATNLNGWAYWEVKRPQDADWIKLTTLREWI